MYVYIYYTYEYVYYIYTHIHIHYCMLYVGSSPLAAWKSPSTPWKSLAWTNRRTIHSAFSLGCSTNLRGQDGSSSGCMDQTLSWCIIDNDIRLKIWMCRDSGVLVKLHSNFYCILGCLKTNMQTKPRSRSQLQNIVHGPKTSWRTHQVHKDN